MQMPLYLKNKNKNKNIIYEITYDHHSANISHATAIIMVLEDITCLFRIQQDQSPKRQVKRKCMSSKQFRHLKSNMNK
jgi:hypothetical protein